MFMPNNKNYKLKLALFLNEFVSCFDPRPGQCSLTACWTLSRCPCGTATSWTGLTTARTVGTGSCCTRPWKKWPFCRSPMRPACGTRAFSAGISRRRNAWTTSGGAKGIHSSACISFLGRDTSRSGPTQPVLPRLARKTRRSGQTGEPELPPKRFLFFYMFSTLVASRIIIRKQFEYLLHF